jgi:two-component system CheB/CheR fusion protein
MLDKLLDINQLEAGIVRPAVADFSIKHLLDEMRAEFAYHAAANRLDWRVVHRTHRSTASRAKHPQSAVQRGEIYDRRQTLLGCRRSGDRLRIEVWDTGPGIPEMELQAIFEEFHQLDNPARQRSKGLGLGLAIVQRLADLLRHKIDVRPRLSAGSVFTIEVPLGRAEATAPPVLGHAEIPEDVPARGTILIVDDDPVVLDMLRLLFDDQGQRTIVAADDHQALEFTEGSNMPDLLLRTTICRTASLGSRSSPEYRRGLSTRYRPLF